ncbi:MAG: FtsX-like permease family protein [Phycisphaerales bacterium]|nr:FtsX-like permease family protein [Phycisphaerales bacterium]
MALTDFTIIRRSLGSRLFATGATVVTVAVAVALLLVLLSMRESWRKAFDRGTGNMHMLVSRDASPLVALLNGVFYANPPQRAIEWAKYNQLADSFPWEFAIPVQYGDSYRGSPVLATSSEFFTAFEPVQGRRWGLASGRFFAPEFADKFEVVAGSAAAATTGMKVGDKLHVTHGASGPGGAAGHEHDEFTYEVVGVLEPSGSAHDRALFTHVTGAWVLHAQDRMERAGTLPKVEVNHAEHDENEHAHDDAAEDHGHDDEEHAHDEDDHAHGDGHAHENEHDHRAVTAADLIEADKLITGIYLRVPTRPGSDNSASIQPAFDQLRRDPSITVAQPTQQIGTLKKVVGNIEQILLAMAAAVLLSSAVSIMVALSTSMDQRRRQIAVLRVLGFSRPRVLSLVLTESALIGAMGAAIGVAVSLAGAWLVTFVMKQKLGLLIEPALSPRWLLAVFVGTTLLAALAGMVPAIMAYRTSVAKNLRPMG